MESENRSSRAPERRREETQISILPYLAISVRQTAELGVTLAHHITWLQLRSETKSSGLTHSGKSWHPRKSRYSRLYNQKSNLRV